MSAMTMNLLSGDPTPATTTAFAWDPQAQLRFHRGCFLLENIAHLGLAPWPKVHDARLCLAEALRLERPSDGWEFGRPPGATRFSRQFSGLIICESCGNFYGQQIWHSNQSCPAYVWECRLNRNKRSTCSPPHIYEELFKMLLAAFMREFVREDPAVLRMVTSALLAVGTEPSEAPHKVAQVLTTPVEDLVVSGDDVRPHVTHGTMRADHVLELVRTDGITVELPFPKGWTPTRRKPLTFR